MTEDIKFPEWACKKGDIKDRELGGPRIDREFGWSRQ